MQVSSFGDPHGIARTWITLALATLIAACGGDAPAPPSLDLSGITAVVERGEDLYLGLGECWDCHGASGAGTDTAPAINHAPSAFDIHYMLNTNPEMAEVSERLQATREDVIALAAYVREFADLEVTAESIAGTGGFHGECPGLVRVRQHGCFRV